MTAARGPKSLNTSLSRILHRGTASGVRQSVRSFQSVLMSEKKNALENWTLKNYDAAKPSINKKQTIVEVWLICYVLERIHIMQF